MSDEHPDLSIGERIPRDTSVTATLDAALAALKETAEALSSLREHSAHVQVLDEKATIAALRKSLEVQGRQLDQLKHEVAELTVTCQVRTTEAKQAQEELSRYQRERDAAVAFIRVFGEEISKADSTLRLGDREQTLRNVRIVVANYNGLKENYDDLENEVSALRLDLPGWQKKVASLTSELRTERLDVAKLEAKLREAERRLAAEQAKPKPAPVPVAPEGFAFLGEERLPKKGEAYLCHDGCVSWAVEDHVPGNQLRRILVKIPELHPDDKPVSARVGYRLTGEYRVAALGEFYVANADGRVRWASGPTIGPYFIAEKVGPE